MATDLMSGASAEMMRPAGGRNHPPTGRAGVAAVRQSAPLPGREAPAREAPAIDKRQLASAVSAIQDHVQNISRDLEFSIDEELGRVIIRVYDAETQEVIRQIPAEEMLKLARQMARAEEGLLLDIKV